MTAVIKKIAITAVAAAVSFSAPATAVDLSTLVKKYEGETDPGFYINRKLDLPRGHEVFVYEDGSTTIVKNGIFFDRNDRRLALKKAIEDRIDVLRAERAAIKFAILTDGSLSRDEKRALWAEFASYRMRLEQLYRDRARTRTVNLDDFEALEEFYAATISVS